jgi:hypothetical protein
VISEQQNAGIEINEQLLGQFKDGKRNGKGQLRYANGKVQDGMWSNDKFIG